MNKKEYQKFHGFSDEDMSIIDALKKIFNGTITNVCSSEERAKIMAAQQAENKININRFWVK